MIWYFSGSPILSRPIRSRFAVITAGLTHTTVEAMLNRAAAQMVAAGTRFWVRLLDPCDSLEEMLADKRAHVKTAILAD